MVRPGRNASIAIALFPTTILLLFNGLWNGPLFRASPTLFWIADVTSHVIIPASMLIWLARSVRVTPLDYGLARGDWQSPFDFIVVSAFVTLIFWVAYRPVTIFAGNILLSEPFGFSYLEALPESRVSRFAISFYFSASAAFFEEAMYRGLPFLLFFGVLKTATAKRLYPLLSAVVFALAHWENGLHEVIGTFSLGLAACLIYMRLRNLWPLIMAHFLIDIGIFS